MLTQQYRGLLALAWRFLADQDAARDVVQDGFCKLWENRAQIDPARAPAWLRQVVRNLCLDNLRRQKRWAVAGESDEEGGDDALSTLPDQQPLASDVVVGKQLNQALGAALIRLPDRQRAAWLLAEAEGLSGAQIADSLSCSPEAVESLLSRARRSLRGEFAALQPQNLARKNNVKALAS